MAVRDVAVLHGQRQFLVPLLVLESDVARHGQAVARRRFLAQRAGDRIQLFTQVFFDQRAGQCLEFVATVKDALLHEATELLRHGRLLEMQQLIAFHVR
ncbi:hypothetical protein D3C87_1698300 [compost metagenome]